MSTITANELKTKGISAIKNAISKGREAVISVRGKNEYVVMTFKEYNFFRECELETALEQSLDDLKKGKIIKESVDKHIKRITRA